MRHRFRWSASLALLGALMMVAGMALQMYQLVQDANRKILDLEHGLMVQETKLNGIRADLMNLCEVTFEALTLIQAELERWQIVEMNVTAYSPFDNKSGMCNDGNPWSTATGTVPGMGTIAVNPNVIPYGSRMYVEGYGWGVAADTGSMIRARTDLIDVFMWTYEEAAQFGRRQATVFWRAP